MAQKATPPRILVRPGLPGHASDRPGHQYPSTTTDIVKLLREAGATVEYELPRDERELVSLNAAPLVLPILLGIGTGTIGSLLANAIERLLGKDTAEKSQLHVRVERGRGNDPDVCEASGLGSDVLETLRAFDEGRDA